VPHQPRKRFGQNFLQDGGVITSIVEAIHPLPGEHVIEIGPGLGALSRPLLEALGQLDAVEIDRDLAATLQEQFSPRLKMHIGDVLEFDFAALGGDLRIVGNLPYNISTPLLFHLADYAANIRDIHVMLQKEIVQRMIAAPGDSNYSRLSVMAQYRFDIELLIEVPPEAFRPAPKVESAVVRLMPLRPLPFAAHDEKTFARVVAAAFSQRRKTLRNSLSKILSAADFAALDIAPSARAQELSVAQFVGIANRVAALAAQPATATPSR
jgi:16S rRNA (adenine1518-N6/adenine1519-N6)-dimethyltransferase